jgi:hypothetical protein
MKLVNKPGVSDVFLSRSKDMKSKKLALFLLAGSSLFAGTRVFFGVGVGPGYYAPPPPPPVVAYTPPYVAPAYTWTAGFGYYGPHYYPRAYYPGRGYYWGRPVYRGWVAPRYYGRPYYHGYYGRR